jgi:hypothetical protein
VILQRLYDTVFDPITGYTSPDLVPPGPQNLEQITPSESVQVFFEKDARSGSMKTKNTLYTTTFEFKDGKTDLVIHLDTAQGKWVEGPGK